MLDRQLLGVSYGIDHGDNQKVVGGRGVGVSEGHDVAVLMNNICWFFLFYD